MNPPLPSPLRFISIGTLLLAAFVILSSWVDLLEAFSPVHTSEIHQAALQQEPLFSKFYKEETQTLIQALSSSLEARQAALHNMRSLRTLALFGLSVCATWVLLSSWRLLSTGSLPKIQVARTLSKAALACAVFRTLDGAQSAALARQSGAAFDFATAFKTNFPQHMETTLTLFSAAFTFSVVALFLWTWRYFQTPQTLALLQTPPSSSPPR
ncbi:MAG: hypothetical protein FWC28_03585 [Proteobacteria bacterium]|nr:hypothetical protein [Cystobacterineae bacterium]MCL2314321.1 hypothetical protein [Pseudomonadota bacterium]